MDRAERAKVAAKEEEEAAQYKLDRRKKQRRRGRGEERKFGDGGPTLFLLPQSSETAPELRATWRPLLLLKRSVAAAAAAAIVSPCWPRDGPCDKMSDGRRPRPARRVRRTKFLG